jgi:hypothetical protein
MYKAIHVHFCFVARQSYAVNMVKVSLSQAVEAHKVVRRRGSQIF